MKRLAVTDFPATLGLLAVCIVIQYASVSVPGLLDHYLVFNVNGSPLHTALTLLTHMLSHGSWDHLKGNFMFGLAFMGYVEKRLGSLNLLKLYLATGICAAIAQLTLGNYNASLVGSSGAIMGMLGSACACFGEKKLDRLAGLIMVGLVLVEQLLNAQGLFSNVAYYAHAGGLVSGALIVPLITKSAPKPDQDNL